MLTESDQHRLRHDYEWYARNLFYIVRTDGTPALLEPRPGQRKLYAAIRTQQEAGVPIRIRVLKSRKIGFSTSAQQMLVQRSSQRANHTARTVAHNKETAGVLFGIGKFGYDHLPEVPWVKPPIRNWSSSRDRKFLHFGEKSLALQNRGEGGLNSELQIDTASEYESGRGLTLNSVHMSETAFWLDARKVVAILNAVPDDPDSFVIDESTANGFNHFKDAWDESEAGHSSFLSVFVGWWEEPTYSTHFVNDDEKETFIKSIGSGPFGEEEPYLVEEFACTPEQLHWRRRTIADKCRADVEVFHQEYPATSMEAFIASGRTVFAKHLLRSVAAAASRTDPEVPSPDNPGPENGMFKAGNEVKKIGRSREFMVAQSALWVPREATGHGDEYPFWRVWEHPRKKDADNAEEGRYVLAVDPAGDPSPEPTKTAAHAAVILDHKTGMQVAELETWHDMDEVTDELLLAALYFNAALIVIETTGGYGMAAVKRLAFDYWYPYMYAGKRLDTKNDDYEGRLGWNTSRSSKNVLEDTMRERLRTGTHGIRSSKLAKQLFNYVDLGKGRTGAEKGKRVDIVMAMEIAQQVRQEEPPRPQIGDAVVVRSQRVVDPRTGW